MSVIVARALPDVRDGLKPVHRRILYTMGEMGLSATSSYRKCAAIVGEVMGKYHPHGDVALYDALVRLAQDFSMRYPLVDGQGNFGSVDGDSAAAMRYTEARLTAIAGEMLADIDKETVDFVDNYDGTQKQPSVLPSKLPNLLINGSSGIAVGMATNIPPHHLGEIVDATIAFIDDPELTSDDLCKYVTGPDFPTGGTIFRYEKQRNLLTGEWETVDAIRQMYAHGRGRVVMRAQVAFEEVRGDRTAIIVTELPYQVNKASLLEKIAELVKDKRVEGIGDLRDESDRDGMRIYIEMKRDANPHKVLNNLFKHTPMQLAFNMNMLALVDGQPQTLPLRSVLGHYLDHRREIIRRRHRVRPRQGTCPGPHPRGTQDRSRGCAPGRALPRSNSVRRADDHERRRSRGSGRRTLRSGELLWPPVDEGEHDHVEGELELGLLVQVVEHLVRVWRRA